MIKSILILTLITTPVLGMMSSGSISDGSDCFIQQLVDSPNKPQLLEKKKVIYNLTAGGKRKKMMRSRRERDLLMESYRKGKLYDEEELKRYQSKVKKQIQARNYKKLLKQATLKKIDLEKLNEENLDKTQKDAVKLITLSFKLAMGVDKVLYDFIASSNLSQKQLDIFEDTFIPRLQANTKEINVEIEKIWDN